MFFEMTKKYYLLKIVFIFIVMIFVASCVCPPCPICPTTTPSITDTPGNSSIFVDDTNGSDLNDGLSEYNAKKTIQAAVDIVENGYTIYIKEGVYFENIIISRTGIKDLPVTIRPYLDENVIIDGGSNISIRTNGLIEYWIIENLTIKSTHRYNLRLGWWGEENANHFIVRNNNLFGANFLMGSYHLWEYNNIDGTGYTQSLGDAGISDAGGSHHNIYRNNIVHDFTHHNARGIWTQGLTHNTLIENNYVYNIMASSGLGQCINLDGASNVEWNHVVRSNIVENCSYVGIQAENVFDSIIEKNKVINSKNAGIIIISYDERVGCGIGGEFNQYGDTDGDNSCRGTNTNIKILQNVIYTESGWSWGYGGIMNWYSSGVEILGNTIISNYGSGNGNINIQGSLEETQDTSIVNNILFSNGGVLICARDIDSIFAENNNLMYRSDERQDIFAYGESCKNYMTINEFKNITELGNGSFVSDPKFFNVDEIDFSLLSNSPAIDAGIGVGAITDFNGNPIPFGDNYDIGAYEFIE